MEEEKKYYVIQVVSREDDSDISYVNIIKSTEGGAEEKANRMAKKAKEETGRPHDAYITDNEQIVKRYKIFFNIHD